jgi:hypothetical protein
VKNFEHGKKKISALHYPTKLPWKIEGGIQIFHDKQKLKQHITLKPELLKISIVIKGWELLNLKRRTDK